MTNYQRGRGIEYRVMQDLEETGWWCMRSASSKGIFDVTAITIHNMELFVKGIQVKTTARKTISPKAGMTLFKNEMFPFDPELVHCSYYISPEYWLWVKGKGWIKYRRTKSGWEINDERKGVKLNEL